MANDPKIQLVVVAFKQNFISDLRKAVANFKRAAKGLLDMFDELPTESTRKSAIIANANEMREKWQGIYDRCVVLEKKFPSAERELSFGITTTFALILKNYLTMVGGDDYDVAMSGATVQKYEWMQALLAQLQASDAADKQRSH